MSTKADLTIGVMYPSKYLACEDLKGKTVTVAISSTSIDAVVMTGGAREMRPVLTLQNPKSGELIQKQLIAGKTNAFAIALLLGSRAADWSGKRIALCPDVDLFGKESVPCIRVAGSPDATPERAEAYAKAWKGERKRGALVARLNRGSTLPPSRMRAATYSPTAGP